MQQSKIQSEVVDRLLSASLSKDINTSLNKSLHLNTPETLAEINNIVYGAEYRNRLGVGDYIANATSGQNEIDGAYYGNGVDEPLVMVGPGADAGLLMGFNLTSGVAPFDAIFEISLLLIPSWEDGGGNVTYTAPFAALGGAILATGGPAARGSETKITLSCDVHTVPFRFRYDLGPNRVVSARICCRAGIPFVITLPELACPSFTFGVKLSTQLLHVGHALGYDANSDFTDLIKTEAGSRVKSLALKVITDGDFITELRSYEVYRLSRGYTSVASCMFPAGGKLLNAGWVKPLDMEIFSLRYWVQVKESHPATSADITFAWGRFMGILEILRSCAVMDLDYLNSRL
jgi:hypothetical protein